MKPADLASADVLPNCITRRALSEARDLLDRVPVFCASCGCDSGYRVSGGIGHAFFLCEDRPGQKNCWAKWQHLVGMRPVPDEVFFERVKQAQLERDGRELGGHEVLEALTNSDHYLSKLARDRSLFAA